MIQEISFLEDYLQLQRLRYSGRADLTFEKKCSPGANLSIAPLLLIVFVENAFKHGADKSMKPPRVKIRIATEDDNKMTLEVVNDLDICPPVVNNDNGISLRNARRRLEQLYQDHYTLDKGKV